MFASCARSHLPSCFLRMESVCPAGLIGVALPGSVTTTESLVHRMSSAQHLDFLDFARAIELRRRLIRLGLRSRGKDRVSDHRRMAGSRNTKSSAIRLKTVWMSPALVALIHFATS